MHSKNLQATEQLDFFTDTTQVGPDGDAVSQHVGMASPAPRSAGDFKSVQPPAQSKASGGQRSKANPKASAPRVANPVAPARKLNRKLYLKDWEVAERYSVTRPTVWRWAKSRPDFPKPVSIAAGTTRWAVADLEVFERGLKTTAQKPSAAGAV